jgi:hypothetical protein
MKGQKEMREDSLLFIDTSKWNKAPKYRRRRAVVFTLLAVFTLTIIWQVAANLWWVGNGYCWGDITECMGLNNP